MKITQKLCGIAVKGLATASVCRVFDKATTAIIVETGVLNGAADATKYVVKAASIGTGLIIGDTVVNKLLKGSGGITCRTTKPRKHHKKTRKQENKKHLKIEGLPTEEVNESLTDEEDIVLLCDEADEEVSEE